ncbi:hypothetical protein SDC9_149128 [bioreactor metagenome]|uniref:Uncharacterized protein n=1 Tax=bioreactor metagenome TaxID=1076179 RepID=A0A645EIS1_9ZZZZ
MLEFTASILELPVTLLSEPFTKSMPDPFVLEPFIAVSVILAVELSPTVELLPTVKLSPSLYPAKTIFDPSGLHFGTEFRLPMWSVSLAL